MIKRWFKRSKPETPPAEGTSFYFFDFDDNIMYLNTPILVRNQATGEEKPLSTQEFASIHPQLGDQQTDWGQFETFADTYKYFSDIPAEELQPGQQQYFVADVAKAVQQAATVWQAPSWKLFARACNHQRPLAIVTARGHAPETIQAGIRVLVETGWIAQAPNYLAVYPVGNPGVRIDQLDDPNLKEGTAVLKRVAIRRAVDQALEQYGPQAAHRFGMSDDDPENVNLIIKAMCDCKQKYPDKRFFVIDTHAGEMVKLEVFPIDYPVTRPKGSAFSEPLR